MPTNKEKQHATHQVIGQRRIIRDFRNSHRDHATQIVAAGAMNIPRCGVNIILSLAWETGTLMMVQARSKL